MAAIANSGYLDFTTYRTTDQTTVEGAYGLKPGDVVKLTGSDSVGLNVAIVLPRANDPTALLSENWGQREQALASLSKSGKLWATYGTSQSLFDSAEQSIKGLGLKILDSSNSNYITSAASQTIWVELNTAAQFKALFGVDPFRSTASGKSFVFWNGNLTLPDAWGAHGLWFDTHNPAPASNLVGNVSVTLPQGPQGIGNRSAAGPTHLAPQDIAGLYDFPLSSQPYPTDPIGLIEPGVGAALPPNETRSFQDLLTRYLGLIGQTGTGTVFVQGADGQQYKDTATGERSLDVGVVSAINPNSNIWLYAGSGTKGNAQSSTFTAYQNAIFYNVPGQHMPAVFSSSFNDVNNPAPGSPFYYAYSQLFVDAALSNQSFFNDMFDGGSGDQVGNGLTNVNDTHTSPYAVLVGGTSISSFASAQSDPTLDPTFVANALAGNLATIWQLVAGGLTSLPQDTAQLQDFIETVWNQYVVTGNTIDPPYQKNHTTSGGVDPTQPVPSYQQNFGLNPVTADPLAQTGRGVPDVSANAGGNLDYIVPGKTMADISFDIGTSAATPLWASLAVRINAVFADQRLPNLGYMNDLLYLAAAVAPAAFNDITVGSNTSSFIHGGPYESDGEQITPTGFGYSALPGYDSVSGLGTPNGELLARALSAIAHAQIYFPNEPAVVDATGSGSWTSGATQSLLFQAGPGSATSIDLITGSQSTSLATTAASGFAWTARFAEQSLQPDFDPGIVLMFDKQAQGGMAGLNVGAGNRLGVSINGSSANPTQANLTADFGFAAFNSTAGTVTVARAVMVAETALGANNQDAVVRMRSDGQDRLSIEFYRVDDMEGTVAGVAPGDPRYAALADSRAYATTTGQTLINGPSYGTFAQTELTGVNAADLIAMKLVNNTHGNTYWDFAQANEQVGGQGLSHLMSYGLNTYGWEDTLGGGDRDYNDLVVGVDFTSASGHGLLVR
jgi:hypothetical protein